MGLFGGKKITCSKCGKATKPHKALVAICESNHMICRKCGKKSFLKDMAGTLNPVGGLKSAMRDLDDSFKPTCVICESKMRGIKKQDLVGIA